ncbi:MAG: class I SAM-dependent methyltransferase [Dehalococcoidia bacterium]
MRRWAQQVIEDLDLCGDETVLDAGCGSGSVTFDLLNKLPDGKIYAIDGSPQMIDQLTESIDDRGVTNVLPILANLTDFELPEPVDVVFSNAVLHWIPDDDGLFDCLARATKNGGRFRAQCGGAGNIVRLMAATHDVEARDPYRQHIPEPIDARKYRTPDDAVAAMSRNGWTNARASLFESPVVFENEDGAVLYLRTIILQQQASILPEDLGDQFLRDVIQEVVQRHGAPFVADYVRLDIWAERGA